MTKKRLVPENFSFLLIELPRIQNVVPIKNEKFPVVLLSTEKNNKLNDSDRY